MKKRKTKKINFIHDGRDWSSLIDAMAGLKSKCYRCGLKNKHTKECLLATKKEERLRKRREIAEKKRRAKKITLTVGELEDKLEEAKDYARDYDW